MSFIQRAWQGKTRLWVVFWVWGILVPAILHLVMSVFYAKKMLPGPAILGWDIAYAIWWSVSVWRCSSNCSSPVWKMLVRAYLIIVAIVILLFVIATPATNNFFKINNQCNQLHLKRAQAQHLTWDEYYKNHKAELDDCKNRGWSAGVVNDQ